MKRTKILATYGPAVASPARLRRLISLGVNVFRVNCSHGETADFIAAAKQVRAAAQTARFPVGLLFDISGPKLRLARFEGRVPVRRGDSIRLTAGDSDLANGLIGVNHPVVISSVKKGQRLFIDDGSLIFNITAADGKEITCRAVNAGELLPAKGINLPDTDIGIPTITAKDKRDIKTAVEIGADYIALSFVRSGDDIIEAKRLVRRHGGNQWVIAKLEKKEAIAALDEILLLADGVMVARGDLGVELPPEELPRLQKKVIRLANRQHKPVIVATQMLESMRFSPRATRAEINDVASAVFDCADAVMLSAETATGKYPLEAVRTMAAVIRATEEEGERREVSIEKHLIESPMTYAVAHAVGDSNRYCDSRAIFAFTTSGYTARLISNLFPPQPVIALTPDSGVMRQLAIMRSVYSVRIKQPSSFDDMLTTVNTLSKKLRLAGKGGRVIVTGGAPFGSTAPTNFMLFHEVS